MIRKGKPLTREHYLAFNYPDGVPEPFGPELENELPPGMRLDEQGRDPTAGK